MKPVLKVVIAEPSLIIRKGLLTVLKKLSTLNIEAAEVADMQQLPALLSWRNLLYSSSSNGAVPYCK